MDANKYQYAQTSNNKENLSKNRVHTLTAEANADLFNITPKRNEMHQLIQQLELPNESLTLSSLSQSPFQTNARRDFGRTRGTNQDKNSDSNSDVLGRSDYQGGTYLGSGNNNMTGGQVEKNMMYTTDELNEEEDYDDQDPSPRFDDYSQQNIEGDDYSDYTNENNRRQRDYSKENKTAQVDTADEEEINDYYHSKSSCRDISPDFTGQSNNEDLTVSQNLISNNNVSQMRLGNQNSKTVGAQNRTFADSVINHRLLTEPHTQNSNHGERQYHRRKNDGNNAALSNNDVDELQYEDEECINERDEESKGDNSSDISGLNSFTQTQYSKNSKMAPSMQFRKIQDPSVDLTEDNMVTKRSPYEGRYQNMDHDASLQLTPDSLSSKWLSTSKSAVTNKQMATDRTVGSEQNNPLKKITANIKAGNNNNFNTNLNLQLLAKHNSSISRDPELESALEENSKHLVSGDSIESSTFPSELKTQPKSEYQNLRMKITQLNIQNGQLTSDVGHLRQGMLERDHQIVQYQAQNQSLQNEWESTKEYLQLLKQKTKDDSKLIPLRGKVLEQARKEITLLKQTILQKDAQIQQLGSKLTSQSDEYNSYHQVSNQEIKKLLTEIDKLHILNESLKRQIEKAQNDTSTQQNQFKHTMEKNQQNSKHQLQQLEDALRNYQKTMADKQNQYTQVVSEIHQLEDIITQKDQTMGKVVSEKQKALIELRNYKERCDDLEKELTQIRQLDNNSIFGNSINMGHGINNINQSKKNSVDSEVKQMKEMLTQQLTKAKEDASKWRIQFKELEVKNAKLEEETKKKLQESISQQSNRLGQDQELLKVNQQLKQQLSKLIDLEADIRLCFELTDKDDIMSNLQKVREDLESIEIIQNEFQKVQNMLQEAQNQIKTYQQQQSVQPTQDNISQFKQNLLLHQGKEIDKLRQDAQSLQEEKSQNEQRYWQLENEYKRSKQELEILQQQLLDSHSIVEKTIEAKQKSDKNVDELKEKLRKLLRQQDEDQATQPTKEQAISSISQAEKRKYLDLIAMVLELDLAEDPLSQANLSLQSSHIDEFEQASRHLAEQKGLVSDLVRQLRSEKQVLSEQKQLLVCELQDNQSQLINSKKDILRMNEQIKDKERHTDALSLELDKLKFKLEFNQQDQQQLINDQSDARDLHRNEVIDMLDELIENDTKQNIINDLAVELNARIEKVRNQEKLKFSSKKQDEQEQSLRSSRVSGGPMIENDKQQIESMNNGEEQEFVQSVAKWLKQSQGANTNKQSMDFFKNEDNTCMLMFNDLMTQQQQQNQNKLTYNMQSNQEVQELKQEVLELKLEIKDKQDMIEQSELSQKISKQQLEEQLSKLNTDMLENNENYQQQLQIKNKNIEQQDTCIEDLQVQIKLLTESLAQKQVEVLKIQEQYSLKELNFDSTQKQHQQHFTQELDLLKETIRQELKQKSQKLDQEYDELEQQRIKMRDGYDKQSKEVEYKYQKRLEVQEKEFRDKLQNMEREVRTGCEKSKDEVVNNIYKEMEEQYDSKIKLLKEEHVTQISQMKQEHQKQLDEARRIKEREIKRLKEENDRAKKSFDEKMKKMSLEIISERESNDAESKLKMEEIQVKNKKDLKLQADKIRAEMRNQIDNVKNDSIKQKAEGEREKKKLITDYQQQVEQIQRELEEQLEHELRVQKELFEKQIKKKIDDKEKAFREQLDEYELEMEKLNEIHRDELKKERERLQNRFAEQIRAEVRSEVREELEIDFRMQLDKAQSKYQKELELIKIQYDDMLRDQVSSFAPKINNYRNAEVQCNMQSKQQERVNQSINQSQFSQITHSETFIEQLKYNFEKDLERQQQVFEVQLVQKQQTTVRIFEELIMLECKKILDSILYKSNTSSKSKELEVKRREANSLINDILSRSDDRKERQMKTSIDSIKVKICEVLRLYKESLEAKLIKNQFVEQIPKPKVQSSRNGAMELSHNISRTSMSNVEFKSEYSESDIHSLAPTPRTLNNSKDDQSVQIQKQFEEYLNKQNSARKNQYSDVKKYLEYTDENNSNQKNVLKKVTPMPNHKGVMMVEVDKVVRDIKMLQQTIKSAKFYRILIPAEEQMQKIDDNVNAEKQGVTNENTLQAYRQLLNDLMKVVIKLNKGVDALSKQQEVYKLKLLNTELKEQLQKIKQEESSKQNSIKVEEILTNYTNKQNTLTEDGHECLQRLEYTQFQINKLQFSLFQFCDLFTTYNEKTGEEGINTNAYEVAQKCKEYIIQYPEDVYTGQDKMQASQNSPNQQKISPEMLSPEETARLVANVFQKLNTAQTNTFETTGYSNSNQLDTYQSFFNTFLSNEDYKKSAENFIKQYQEHQQLNQTHKTSTKINLPLQRSQDHFNSRCQLPMASYQQSDIPLQMKDKKRSQSQALKDTNNSCSLPQYVSNVFQSNMLDKQSMHSYQPVVYDTQSQGSFIKSNLFQDHQLNNPTIIPQQQQRLNFQQNSISQPDMSYAVSAQSLHSLDNITSATQQNMNALFNKLKLNFNVPQMQDSFHQ